MQHNHRSERPVKRRDLWGQGIPGAVLLIVWSILCGALEIGQVPYVSWCLICSQFLLLIVKRVAEQCTCFIPAMFEPFLIGLHPSCSLGSTIPLVFFYSLFSICSIVCLLYCRSNLQECWIGCSCFFLRLLFVFVPLFHSHDRDLFPNLLTQDLLLYLKGNFTF